jgi:hypothetical protein
MMCYKSVIRKLQCIKLKFFATRYLMILILSIDHNFMYYKLKIKLKEMIKLNHIAPK